MLDTTETFFEVEVDELGVPLAVEERENRKLFEGGEVYVEEIDKTLSLEPLAIASNAKMMRLQGEIPVISVDFKDVSGASYGAALSGMKKLVHRAFLDHKYLLHSKRLQTNEIEVFTKYIDRVNYLDLTKEEVSSALIYLVNCFISILEEKL